MGKPDSHMQKNEIGPLFHTIHKNELKMDKRLECLRPETVKLLEENTGGKCLDIDLGDDFLTPKVKEIKAKINKWELNKLKRFCTAKQTINKTKRQPTEWEKIFANDMTSNGLIFNVYKQLIQLNISHTHTHTHTHTEKSTQLKNRQKN